MHTAPGFQLIRNHVRVLMFLVLIHLPWINTCDFFAFSFHRLHRSHNSYFYIIEMTLPEQERASERDPFLHLFFAGRVLSFLNCAWKTSAHNVYLYPTPKSRV